jgi:two-component system chemotaxis response regulator CheY
MAKNILIVDDSSAIRQSVGFVLEQAGFVVVQASDGVEALAKLGTQTFDLIVTDVNMPNMNGIELTKNVRKIDKHKFTPVIMLTTESQSGMMQEGKAAGATGWIVKPFDADKLLGVVKKLLG